AEIQHLLAASDFDLGGLHRGDDPLRLVEPRRFQAVQFAGKVRKEFAGHRSSPVTLSRTRRWQTMAKPARSIPDIGCRLMTNNHTGQANVRTAALACGNREVEARR